MLPLSVFSVNLVSSHLLLLLPLLVFVAVPLTKVGSRLGAPVLLLFLLLGMACGADGLGIYYEDYHQAEAIGHFAMMIILFSSGLETSFRKTKPVLAQGILLSTVGVFLMVLLTGTLIWLVARPLASARTPLLGCFLLAAIMASTDSASVFSVLRGKRLLLRERLAYQLEFESGSNDPIAMVLTLVFVQSIQLMETASASTWYIIGHGVGFFLLQVAVGLAVGWLFSYAAIWSIRKIKLDSSPLFSIFVLSIGLLAGGLATPLHGNSLLAIYVVALRIGNMEELPYRKDLVKLFSGMTWLVQLLMFLILGLLARPSQMPGVLIPAIIIALLMIFVTRPLSVFLTLAPFRKMSFRAKAFTSWVGLKGAGPILFALSPVVAGFGGSSQLFNVVFCVTLLSLVIQGMTLVPMARWLKLSFDEDPEVETFGVEMPKEMGMLRDHIITGEEFVLGNTLRDLSLPHGIRVVMVRRDGKYLVPHGSMALQKGDHLLIVMGESDD